MADEGAAGMRDFFVPDTHAQRLAFACQAYPRKQAPGTRWVYHTSDPYLLGTVLQHALRRLPDRAQDDLFDAVLCPGVPGPIRLSPPAPATPPRRDDARQPFLRWGLCLLSAPL